jgi:hypothetical protein
MVRREIPGLNPGTALDTCGLECGRGSWNSQCRGEIRRYWEEHQWRRRRPGPLTDAEARKRGEQTGLDTLVVHAINDEN